MTHSYQFDPRTILGVSSTASLSEIRDAYRKKSLKHHPDKGGDEWAFRMVARAYEILSTARVVDRTADEGTRVARPQPAARPSTASWSAHFGHPQGPEAGPAVSSNIAGWSGEHRSHEGMGPAAMAKIVEAELLILRFELECSLDLFARRPEDRNLSCTLHIAWPIADLAERASVLPETAATIALLGEAVKDRDIRKHATTKRAHAEASRFDAWFTYPTAVMASEALEAFRLAIAGRGLEIEKQVREMSIPRQWK